MDFCSCNRSQKAACVQQHAHFQAFILKEKPYVVVIVIKNPPVNMGLFSLAVQLNRVVYNQTVICCVGSLFPVMNELLE